jgi:hypothetical protein
MAVYHCRCAFLWFFLLHKQKKEHKNYALSPLAGGSASILNIFQQGVDHVELAI